MDYLFEIFTEEIPASLLNTTVKNVKLLAEKKIAGFNIGYKKIETFGTPRRLTLFIWGIDAKEKDITEEVKGPPISIVFDKEGKPTKVYEKFLSSNNLTENDVFRKTTEKGEYLFGKKVIKGRAANQIVKDISLFILNNLSFPNSMYWIDPKIKFIRPIRGLIALLDGEIIDFSYAGVKTGRATYGLRIDKPKIVEIQSPEDYLKKVKEHYVIISYNERRKMAERNMKIEAAKVNGVPYYTQSHLEEVVNLTEYPTPFLAQIDKESTSIPACITESIVEGHLKSIVVRDSAGKLLPYFIGIRNGLSDFIEVVKEGYEKVVRARVLDGKFFFEEDKKSRLDDFVEKLKGVIFIRGLGNLFDKTNRLVSLSQSIGELLNLDEEKIKLLKRAAFLSKADLVSNVVREFPNLQGKMGSIYAELQGEDSEVAKALEEQYLPVSGKGDLPKTEIGRLLSLIDKVDTLVGAFGIGVKVSGSRDPFGLRRIGNGIVQILFTMRVPSFPLKDLISSSINIFKANGFEIQNNQDEVNAFLKDRAKSILKDLGFRYDVINSVVALPIDFMPTFAERAKVLEKHLNEETLLYIALSNKRVKNILSKAGEKIGQVDTNLFFERDEEALYDMIVSTKKRIETHIEQMNYEEVMNLFYSLHPVISQFFDNVLVMDRDKKVRANRLALLLELKKLFDSFADFSEIAVEKK